MTANILKKGLWKVSNVWTKYHFRKYVGMVTDVSLIRKTPFILLFSKKLKVGPPTSKKNCVICFIERSLKMMKNAFYFILKALSVLKIFQFLFSFFLPCRKNVFIRKIITTWLKSNTYIAQYLTKKRQAYNEIWSVNRI